MLVLPLVLLFQTAPDPPPPEGALVQVRPGSKRYFHLGGYEKKGCPARIAACRRKAYVLPGDQLVAKDVRGGFTQVVYLAPGRTDPSEGWIESDALQPVVPGAAKPEAWIGAWAEWDNEIEIGRGAGPDSLRISGTALWGSRDPERVERGGVHVGEIDGEAVLRNGMLLYADSDPGQTCRIRMRLLGPYLLVADNGQCGGMNVTFGGT